MKVKKKLCDHCGASMIVNYYAMNKALIGALHKIAVKPGGGKACEFGFSRVEYSVYTKLKWWGLITPYGDDEGCWMITPNGTEFLAGEIRVPKKVGYFRNRLVESTIDEEIYIDQVKGGSESRRKYVEQMREFVSNKTDQLPLF
jgi:hypothetical protein